MRNVLLGIVASLCILYVLLQLGSANRISASQPFLNNKVQLFVEVSRAASIIAVNQDESSVSEAANKLQQISAGPIFLLGDERVIWAISLFNTCFAEPENEKCTDRDLRQLSAGLSKAMRLSLSEPTNIANVGSN